MVAPRDNSGSERDIFRPPVISTEVSCLHCGEVYDSYLIEWREGAGPPGDAGAWCCPTPGCDGLGFLFDIWPTDPEWRDEHGQKVCWIDDDDEQSEFDDDAMLGDEGFDAPEPPWSSPSGPSNASNDPEIGLPPDFFFRHPNPPDSHFTDDDIPY